MVACNWMLTAEMGRSGHIPNSTIYVRAGFHGGSAGKESACNAGDLGSIPGLGKSPRGGHGNSLQCSCLENPHGVWRATAHGLVRSRTQLDD